MMLHLSKTWEMVFMGRTRKLLSGVYVRLGKEERNTKKSALADVNHLRKLLKFNPKLPQTHSVHDRGGL